MAGHEAVAPGGADITALVSDSIQGGLDRDIKRGQIKSQEKLGLGNIELGLQGLGLQGVGLDLQRVRSRVRLRGVHILSVLAAGFCWGWQPNGDVDHGSATTQYTVPNTARVPGGDDLLVQPPGAIAPRLEHHADHRNATEQLNSSPYRLHRIRGHRYGRVQALLWGGV